MRMLLWWRAAPLLAGALLVFGWCGSACAETSPEYAGSEMCGACHKDLYDKWKLTPHSQALSDPKRSKEESGCEACHGPGGAHPGDPDHKSIINPAKLGASESADVCLRCHKKELTKHGWLGTAHARGKMRCTSCHDMHAATSRDALTKDPVELCLGCHKRERGQFMLTSHHPLFEGRMVCTDCHDVHDGAENGMLLDSPEKELCVRCHREKEGPFAFEHGAISDGFGEGCLSCHRPHGSTNNDLQRLTGRGLCLQCHTEMHIGSTSAGADANCTTCHRMVHGSDRDELFFE